MTNLQLT